MVLEGLTALGLACNVLQLIEFTAKIVSNSREIYKSSTGIPNDRVALKTVVDDLNKHSKQIEVSNNHPEDLRKLALQARAISEEVLAALAKIQVEGKNTRWRSFMSAFKEAWSREKIKEMTDQLSEVRSQMNFQAQLLIRFAGPTLRCR